MRGPPGNGRAAKRGCVARRTTSGQPSRGARRQRRLAETFDEGEERIEQGVRQGLRYGRETQLAAEGAMLLLYRWSRRTFGELVRAGREWEDETVMPNRRRRISLDDEGE